MRLQLTKHLITTEAFHRMAETGILEPEAKVELLQGEIIYKSPIGSKHALCVNKLNALLVPIVGNQACVSIQNPIVLSEYSEPEPDLAILRAPIDQYAEQHPQASDVLLLIEVADSSLEKDRQIKLPLYAAASIEEVWIVNLAEEFVEVYTDPSVDRYDTINLFNNNQMILLTALNIRLSVNDFL